MAKDDYGLTGGGFPPVVKLNSELLTSLISSAKVILGKGADRVEP